jgi:hypothetical protein
VCAAAGTLLLIPVLGFYYVLQGMQEEVYEEPCRQLTALAQDPQKIKYVREWAASRLNDPSFMNAVRQYDGWFRTDWHHQYIDLDRGYLGLYPDAWVEFNIYTDADIRYVNAKKVGSISLHVIRSSIIIGLRGEAGLGLIGTPEYMKTLKGFGNQVFVDCECTPDIHRAVRTPASCLVQPHSTGAGHVSAGALGSWAWRTFAPAAPH